MPPVKNQNTYYSQTEKKKENKILQMLMIAFSTLKLVNFCFKIL